MLDAGPPVLKVHLVHLSMIHGSMVGLVRAMMVVGSLQNTWKVFEGHSMSIVTKMIGLNIVAMKRLELRKKKSKLKIRLNNACDVNWTVIGLVSKPKETVAGNVNKTVKFCAPFSTVSATI